MAPIYMRISALDPAHRLAILALSFVGILAVPPITTLGRPLEPLWACCVLVLGEAVGYLIERRMRLSHGNRQGQQLASAVPGINQCEAEAPSEMTPTFRSMPWTLTFTDHALERAYTAEAFRAGYRPFVALCAGALVLLNALLIVVPTTRVQMSAPVNIATAAIGVAIASRLWFDRMQDQQRARVLFGRVCIVVVFARCASTVLWARSSAPAVYLSPAGAVLIPFVLWFTTQNSWKVPQMAILS